MLSPSKAPRTNFAGVLAEVEASADQAFELVPHFHTGKLERPRHLVACEQTEFDTLAIMLDAGRRALQIMIQQNR